MGSLIPYRFREGFVPVRSRAGVLVCYWFGGIPTQLQLDIFSLDHIGVLTPIPLGRHDCYLGIDHMEGIDSFYGE